MLGRSGWLSLFVSLALSTGLQAAEQRIGLAAKVVNQVFSGSLLEPLLLKQGVTYNEQITTEADSAAIIQFDDQSTLNIGPGSKVVLDDFVYDPSSKTPLHGVVRVLDGALSFIGSKPQKDLAFATTAGTIGIRGTVFGMKVQGGTTGVEVVQGVVAVGNGAGSRTLTDGQYASLSTGQPPTLAPPPPEFRAAINKIEGLLGPEAKIYGRFAAKTNTPPARPPGASSAPITGRSQVRDPQGQVIGTYFKHGDGTIDAVDVSGHIRAIYDPARDATFDLAGNTLGAGNRLANILLGK